MEDRSREERAGMETGTHTGMQSGASTGGYPTEMGRQEGVSERAQHAASDMSERAGSMASQASEQASRAEEMGRDRAAQGAEQAASMIREHTGDGAVGTAGEKAAAGMDKTARYLRENDPSAMLGDIEDYVREHPVQGIAGAVAAGFLVGRMLR